jgi:hypothetical protein
LETCGSTRIGLRRGFDHDDAANEVGALGGEQDGGQTTERLADDDSRHEVELADPHRCVLDERRRRDVGRRAFAAPVATLLWHDDSVVFGEPRRGPVPLTCVSGEPVKQEDGRA